MMKKTNLMVLGSRKNKVVREQVLLKAGNYEIQPTSTGKLLGCELSDDLKWKYHIRDSNQSLIKQLTSRVNGLTMIASRADFTTRLMVANGLVMSKLCYLIQLWGGCEGYLLHSLQILLNKAARSVTKMSGFTSTKRLMTACSWLSVKQLVVYHRLIMVFKTLKTETPSYLHSRLNTTPHTIGTRQSTTGGIRQDESYRWRSSIKCNSMRYRATIDYNRIPVEIRTCESLVTFKNKLKQWVKENVDIV